MMKSLIPQCQLSFKMYTLESHFARYLKRVNIFVFSGGIKRDWIGFPRKFHQPGSGVTRCACVNLKSEESKNLGNFEVYKNCNPNAVSCYL